MGLTLLDFILLGIMALSGLLALMRGFTREALSLVAWGLAALAGYLASQQPQIVGLLLPFLDKPFVAQVAAGLGTAVVVLIIVSIMSVRISDTVIDSSASAIDRTLGFIYGLGRGLVLVAIAYLFYGFFQPPERQEEWVRGAQSFSVVQGTGKTINNIIRSYFSADVADTLDRSLTSSGTTEAAPDVVPLPEQPVGNSDQQGLNNLSNDAATPETGQDGVVGETPDPAKPDPAKPAAPAAGTEKQQQ
jgi:membrane protein required for colicin V production